MELILALSLFLNLCYTVPELNQRYTSLKKLYLEYKNKNIKTK